MHCIGDFVQSIGVALAGALIWWHQVGLGRSTSSKRSALCGTGWKQQAMATEVIGRSELGRVYRVDIASQRPTAVHPTDLFAGRPAVAHCRPDLHLPLCHPGALQHSVYLQLCCICNTSLCSCC